MARDYRNSDYARNKYSENIVYVSSEGVVEVTKEEFLRNNPEYTEKDYEFFKEWSDENYLKQVRKDNSEKRLAFSMNDFEETELLSVPSAECDFFEQEKAKKISEENIEEILSILTYTQRRRYLMNVMAGLSTPQIAKIEGISQVMAWKSIEAANKKIKKIIKNFEK